MINVKNLQLAVQALRESPDPEAFDMAGYGTCGTPACVFGHLANRTDLQKVFRLGPNGGGVYSADQKFPERLAYCHPKVRGFFGVDAFQVEELFGADGCGDAKTAEAAAAYIERFILDHK